MSRAPPIAMVAVHAWRSAAPIERFKATFPERPVILQLSGTDIYHYIDTDPVPTLRSMELADRLVALNDLAWRAVPKRLRARLTVIHQSAAPLPHPRRPSRDAVVVSVIGHLRDVKDPLRAAAAARLLPADSRVRIEQVGRAYTPEWANACPRRDGRQPALSLAGRRAGCRRPATSGAQPCHGHLVAERRRRQRDLGGGRRRCAGAGLAHRRQCRPARQPTIPATSRSATPKRSRGCFSGWSASRASRRGWAKRWPGVRCCSGRRARLPPGAACSPTSAAVECQKPFMEKFEGGCLCGAVRLPPRVRPNQFSGVIAKAAESTAARRFPCSSVSSTAPMS